MVGKKTRRAIAFVFWRFSNSRILMVKNGWKDIVYAQWRENVYKAPLLWALYLAHLPKLQPQACPHSAAHSHPPLKPINHLIDISPLTIKSPLSKRLNQAILQRGLLLTHTFSLSNTPYHFNTFLSIDTPPLFLLSIFFSAFYFLYLFFFSFSFSSSTHQMKEGLKQHNLSCLVEVKDLKQPCSWLKIFNQKFQIKKKIERK